MWAESAEEKKSEQLVAMFIFQTKSLLQCTAIEVSYIGDNIMRSLIFHMEHKSCEPTTLMIVAEQDVKL